MALTDYIHPRILKLFQTIHGMLFPVVATSASVASSPVSAPGVPRAYSWKQRRDRLRRVGIQQETD